jgi:glucose/arabinose dehydrogenase
LYWEPIAEGFGAANDLADVGDGRLLISDQAGMLYLWADGELVEEPLLDISNRVLQPSNNAAEMGLSGFAVHPDFLRNGRIFVMYTAVPPEGASGASRVDVLAEFAIPGYESPGLGPVDVESEREILALEQDGGDHVGGHMAFDDEGMLFVGLGTSGSNDRAQDPSDLMGSVIRIDVDETVQPYAIPEDNPFVDGGGAPEVYSYGFRNPFRVSWDDEIGLLIAEPMWRSKNQELEVAVPGGNFGYPLVHPGLDTGACHEPGATLAAEACVTGPEGQEFVAPVLDYGRDFGQIVSGAVRYTATSIPDLTGKVIVADWRGPILAATPGEPGERWATEPVDAEFGEDFLGDYLWALDSDSAGEVYALTTSGFREGGGKVYRLTSR